MVLALGWIITFVVLSYLRAQAVLFGLDVRVLVGASAGAAALALLSVAMLLFV